MASLSKMRLQIAIELRLDLFVFDDRLDDHVAVGQRADRSAMVAVVSWPRAASISSDVIRPILMRDCMVCTMAVLPLLRAAASTSSSSVGMPRRRWAPAMPAPMMPAPSTPTRSTLRGCTGGVGHARVLLQPLRHEENARSGCATRCCRPAARNGPSRSSGLLRAACCSFSRWRRWRPAGRGAGPFVLASTWPRATAKVKAS